MSKSEVKMEVDVFLVPRKIEKKKMKSPLLWDVHCLLYTGSDSMLDLRSGHFNYNYITSL